MSAAATTLDDMLLAADPTAEAEWWYRTAGGTSGPVSAAELRRLSFGPLGGDTLVWRKGSGERWRRLAEALAPAERSGPPPLDYGRWAKAFAAIEADPNGLHLSPLGLLGPVGYLFLGMWRRYLVLFAAVELARVPCLVVDGVYGTPLRFLPFVVAVGFCVWRVKADYYRHRVIGERMWPRLRFMRSAWACAPAAAVSMFAALLVARAVVLFAPLPPTASMASTAPSSRIASSAPTATAAFPDPSDPMTSDVAGLWRGEAGDVLLDVAGDAKRITYGGRTRAVRVVKVDEDGEGVVFEVLPADGERIAVRRRWSEDRTTWSLDLYDGDLLIANLLYLKPV